MLKGWIEVSCLFPVPGRAQFVTFFDKYSDVQHQNRAQSLECCIKVKLAEGRGRRIKLKHDNL